MTFSTYFSPGVALQGGGSSGGGGGAATAPLTGTGATVTTSQPLIDVSQTWNAGGVTFTGWKLNITNTASAAASLLMDLQVGGASQFNVDRSGTIQFGPPANATQWVSQSTTAIMFNASGSNRVQLSLGVKVGSTSVFQWSSTADANDSADLILGRRAAANLRLGAADAAAPVAQTLSVQSVVAGTSNTAGANFTIDGSQGTGTGAGGSIVFRVAPAGSSGSAVNALSTALAINSVGQLLVSTVANSTLASIGTLTSSSSGFFTTNGFDWGYTRAGSSVAYFTNSGLRLAPGLNFAWSGTAGDPAAASDLILTRDAANTLAQKNGTNAQEFRVYENETGTIYKAILGNRQLMKISGAAFDNGAGASAGTLTNSPSAGNPTKWIPINDNGTTRYIPAW